MEIEMKLEIVKWGNSAALRLPAPLLAQLGAHVGKSFEVEVSKGRLILRVAQDDRTIDLRVVHSDDGRLLSLLITDQALGKGSAHLGSDRLQSNPDHAEFYEAVIQAIVALKRDGAKVTYNGAQL